RSEVITHQFLSDIMNTKLDKLEEAKDKLEALNLLNTYQDQNHFVYQLKSPLTPRGFLKDTVLGQFLQTELGPKMYRELTGKFKVEKFDLSNFNQVTKNFDDVFNFVGMNDFVDAHMYLGKKTNSGAKIKDQINYEAFIEKLPDRVKKPVLMFEKTKDLIQKLVFVYQLSLDEIADIYLKTVEPNGEIDLQLLQTKAKNYYQEKKDKHLTVLETKQMNGNENWIHVLKNTSPMVIVESYAKNDYQGIATET